MSVSSADTLAASLQKKQKKKQMQIKQIRWKTTDPHLILFSKSKQHLLVPAMVGFYFISYIHLLSPVQTVQQTHAATLLFLPT